MRTTALLLLTLLQFIYTPFCISQEMNENNSDFKVLKKPYLDQKPPGMTPNVFAKEIFLNKRVLGICIIKGGEEFYYSQFGVSSGSRIMYMHIENGKWTPPNIAPFSGRYRDWDLNVSPDGKKIYFSSTRPLKKDGIPKKDADIWFTENIQGIWTEPKNIGPPINSDKYEYHPSIAENGNLYFMGRDPIVQIYFAKYADGHYLEPVKLGNEINDPEFDTCDPFVAPDESYLIFHSNRNGGFGKMDLYISFRIENKNKWTKAINMGKIINSEDHELCARVSLDGKYFFFTKGNDIYWVDSKIIDELRLKN